MFVAPGARAKLLDVRRQQFAARYVEPLVAEASRLGFWEPRALVDLIIATHNSNNSNGKEAPSHDTGDLGDRPDPALRRLTRRSTT